MKFEERYESKYFGQLGIKATIKYGGLGIKR